MEAYIEGCGESLNIGLALKTPPSRGHNNSTKPTFIIIRAVRFLQLVDLLGQNHNFQAHVL